MRQERMELKAETIFFQLAMENQNTQEDIFGNMLMNDFVFCQKEETGQKIIEILGGRIDG